ncbi:hypothetical protein [Sinomonas sp.]|jgi:hypothetical protein|uniref:hypothetical protein n=1 Tax=Sinomonas sp. TaxID=1914986 RepID=UPI002FE3C73F
MPSSLAAAIALEGLRLLAALGWSISLRALGWLAIITAAAIALLAFAAGLTVFRLLCSLEAEGVIPLNGTAGSLASFTAITVVIYLAGGVALREMLGPRRLAVQGNPNRGLFRALDVEMRHVFLATCGPRGLVVFLASASLATSAVATLAMSGLARPASVLLLTATPFAATAAVLGIGGWLAAHEARPFTLAHRSAVVMLGSAALGVPAYLGTRLLSGGLEPRGWRLPTMWEPVAAAGILAAGLGGAWLLTVSWARMSRDSFPLRSSRTIRRPRTSKAINPTAALWLNLVSSRHHHAIASTVSLVTLAASTAAAVRLGGFQAEKAGPSASIGTVVPCMALVVTLTVAELLSKDNGLVVLVPRLRVLWENGSSTRSLISGVLCTQLGFTLALLTPGFAVMGWAATGVPFWGAPSVIAAAASATVLGSSVSTAVVKQADGSADVSLAAALLTLLAAAPAGLLALIPGLFGLIASCLYTVILLGGVALCFRQRIIRLPSASRE